ncbi:MAG TPA: type II secretion system F family protein [Polyangia bacterium]|jgi:tight adherence protein C
MSGLGSFLGTNGLVLLAGLAITVAGVALMKGVLLLAGGHDQAAGRLRGAGGGAAPGGAFTDLLARGLRPLARAAQPGGEQASRLRLALVRAGRRGPHAAELFLATKVLLALALPALFVAVNARLAAPFDHASLIAVVLAALGFYGPNTWLRGREKARQLAVSRALPDAMDLLVTCVEAGLGVDAAIIRVAREMRLAAPILSEELELTSLEIQAGVSRSDAFRRLSERVGLDDLKSLSATLVQTEIFGTSVARALRVHAEGMRVRRMQQAEERAAVVAVKLTLPLVFCILPALFVVVVGPAIVNIMEVLFPSFGGGR